VNITSLIELDLGVTDSLSIFGESFFIGLVSVGGGNLSLVERDLLLFSTA